MVLISFLNRTRFEKAPAYHHEFRLRTADGLELTDHLRIHVVELPKFRLTAEQLSEPVQVWCYFLRHGEGLDAEKLPVALDTPPVKRAMEVLTVMSQDTQQREAYEARQRAWRDLESDIRSGNQEAFDRGAAVGKIELCQYLLGLPQTPRNELAQETDEDLAQLAAELQERVKTRP